MHIHELWSVTPTIRVARLERGLHTSADNIALSYAPAPSLVSRQQSSQTPVAALPRLWLRSRHIINPQFAMPEGQFEMLPGDREETRYDADPDLHGMRYIVREVGEVVFNNVTSLGSIVDQMHQLAPFMDNYGYLPCDPRDVYRQWCEMQSVQPVATFTHDLPHATAFGGVHARLSSALRARSVNARDEEIYDITLRLAIGSPTRQRFAENGSTLAGYIMASNAPLNPDAVRTLRHYLTPDMLDDLQMSAIMDTVDARVGATLGQSLRDAQRALQTGPARGDAWSALVDAIDPAPVSVVGIRIPINHPGRRPLNLETPHETSNPEHPSYRLYPDRPGGDGRHASGTRRAVRLVD